MLDRNRRGLFILLIAIHNDHTYICRTCRYTLRKNTDVMLKRKRKKKQNKHNNKSKYNNHPKYVAPSQKKNKKRKEDKDKILILLRSRVDA